MGIAFNRNHLLYAICGFVWLLCAYQPMDRQTWALEQVATVAAIGVLLLWRRYQLSFTALLGLAVLFCAHTIGTHYTYSLTPIAQWLGAIPGIAGDHLLGWERNHYDRFVHFLWGLCAAQTMHEWALQRFRVGSKAADVISLHVLISVSALYELIEWAAAVVFGDGSTAYLGMQGDVWDAQADMALCIPGIALSILARKLYTVAATTRRNC